MSQLQHPGDLPDSRDRQQDMPDQNKPSVQPSNQISEDQTSSLSDPQHTFDLVSQPSPELHTSRRKPIPSPLKSTGTFGPGAPADEHSPSTTINGHSFPGSNAASPRTPRGPFGQSTSGQTQPQSPRERLDALLASEGSELPPADSPQPPTSSVESNLDPGASSKQTSYGQLRNASAPNSLARPSGAPPPGSPALTALSASHRSDMRPMMRTSSIDSAISSISSQTSQSHKPSQDSVIPNPSDIANLISAAGSPDALIQHLLKEKHSAASQNGQLWRLVDKQRAMILGLNKDLERALKDKDRYRRKLREHVGQSQIPPGMAPSVTPDGGRAESGSPPSRDLHGAAAERHESPSNLMPAALRQVGATPPIERSEEALDQASRHAMSHDEAQAPAPLNFQPPRTPRDTNVHQRDDSTSPKHVSPPREEATSSRQTGPAGNEQAPTHSKAEAGSPLQTMNKSSPRGFGANLVLPSRSLSTENAPTFKITEPTPIRETSPWSQHRKAPPKPLKLSQPSGANQASAHLHQLGPEDHSDSEYDDILEVDEIPAFERGRRRTREEDDREREMIAHKESEGRSRSKKEKGIKSPVPKLPPGIQSNADQKPGSNESAAFSPPLKQAVPISPPGFGPDTMNAHSLAAVLGQPSHTTQPTDSATEATGSAQSSQRFVSPPPMSPGLPTSPRPTDRPVNSPTPRLPRDGARMSSLASPPLSPSSGPTSPRNGPTGGPLSPRPPRGPIPLPPNTPQSLVSPGLPKQETTSMVSPPALSLNDGSPIPATETAQAPSMEAVEHSRPDQSRGVYHGFMSERYPNLLLPPDALSSIAVRVSSSRLKPSRASFISGKTKSSEEEAVFTLAVVARASNKELWRVEKEVISLPMLDHQLKKGCKFAGKLPDRSLFSGHAPAKIDARRAALDQYLESVLETPMDERVALVVGQFLCTDPLEPEEDDNRQLLAPSTGDGPSQPESNARPRKEGYLTKRGKNFGGWKARFFCLDGPILRYYEAPGGPHLGTIKLVNAQIGKQSQQKSNGSPSRGDVDDVDNQYRHAFLILEPKKKDSASLVRHVLCAESDAERDAWVSALLQYVDDHGSEDEASTNGPVNTSEETKAPVRSSVTRPGPPPRQGSDKTVDSELDTLRGVSYEDTVQAEAPVHGSGSNKSMAAPPVNEQSSRGSVAHTAHFHSAKQISGPRNGVKIQDAGAWGNKPSPLNLQEKKEPKKRSLWGFKGRSSSGDLNVNSASNNSSTPSLHQQQFVARNGPVRAVFGAPLAEAAECCQPVGVDVYLPAVVFRSIEYLDAKNAAREEGIFRLSGSNVLIKSLRERFNTEGDVDLIGSGQYYDIHAVASLLKLYLRELPATVLTRELHLDFLQVIEIDNKPDKITALNRLVHRLPRANHSLLRALSAFLITIVNNSETNKMTVRNVGIVFSPTLNIPAPVLSMFINEFQDIFGSDPEDHSPSSPTRPVDLSVPMTQITSDDIRSPRRQMFQDLPTPAYNQSTFAPNGRGYGMIAPSHHYDNDTGFIPLQPSYEQPMLGQSPYMQGHNPPMTLGGPEYASLNGALAPVDGRDTKARRRESSMLMMGMGQKQSSMPQLRENRGMVQDDSAFG